MLEDKIIIKGAKVHNLKGVDLELPKNKLVVFTGVSGSGKSSLAFDTIFAEGQRRYIESLSPYVRQFLGQMDRPNVDKIIGLSPAIAIDQRALSHNPRSTVGTLTEIYDYLRVLYARLGEVFCPKCGEKIEKLSPEEMVNIIIEEGKKLKEETVTILAPVVRSRKGEYYQMLYDFLSFGFAEARVDGKMHSLHNRIVLSRYKNHSIDIVMDRVTLTDETRLFEAVENSLDHAKGLVTAIFKEKHKEVKEMTLSNRWTCPNDNFSFPEIEPRLFSFNSPVGACPTCHGLGRTDLFLNTICPACGGKRLKPEALSVKIGHKNIYQVTSMSIDQSHDFFLDYEEKLSKRNKIIASGLVKEIADRLKFLLQVGLEYLSLSREAETLSGGEAQRIRLASQIGSQLSGTLYVLDEPTIGLHERDTEKLIKTLKALREQKNTVIIVEHDEKSILNSDYFVDLGPGAGRLGGEVVAEGEIPQILTSKKYPRSLTLDYLSGRKKIVLPAHRRSRIHEKLKVIGAKVNNLKNINVEVPLRKFVCVTGVSGSGKSTLLYDVLYQNVNKIKGHFGNKLIGVKQINGTEYLDKVVLVNQSPIGRTPRSNPATYTGIFTPIRDFFAELPEAKERGYKASRFSFNVPGGRCEACGGAGFNLVEMHFLPPVLVQCEVCRGQRFSRETLQVKYKKKNISEILNLTIDDAYDFFKDIYQITDKLKVLKEVGLGYIQLGQSATTLSGGEAQRIKLSRELTQPLGKRTLYLLDEPTVGLHYQDIEMLLKVLNKLVDKGNTVIVIEHNLHFIKSADYLIDLGPEGGDHGGEIVAFGAPEEVAIKKGSYTGYYLKDYLK
jgi:excinuclease ABC subunit A